MCSSDLHNAGRYADAARVLDQAVKLDPGNYQTWFNLGAGLERIPSERARAVAAFEQTVRYASAAKRADPKDSLALAHLASAYARLNRSREAREAADAAAALKPERDGTMFMLATVYEDLGDRRQAISWLKHALDAGYSKERIDRSPSLVELRKDPRYVALVK